LAEPAKHVMCASAAQVLIVCGSDNASWDSGAFLTPVSALLVGCTRGTLVGEKVSPFGAVRHVHTSSKAKLMPDANALIVLACQGPVIALEDTPVGMEAAVMEAFPDLARGLQATPASRAMLPTCYWPPWDASRIDNMTITVSGQVQ
jgi:hypothetical protein